MQVMKYNNHSRSGEGSFYLLGGWVVVGGGGGGGTHKQDRLGGHGVRTLTEIIPLFLQLLKWSSPQTSLLGAWGGNT